MGWEEYRVEKWEDFVSMVEAFGIGEHGDTNWFFRGQSKEEWGLTPSLGRLFKPDSDVRYGLHVESRATNLFRERFHLHHDADGVNRDDWSVHAWWALMQHYGCPTRMLDWTASPYVALYFAVESNFNTNGAVWLFPTDLLGRAVLADHGEIDWKAEKGQPTAKWNASDVRAVYDLKLTVHSQRSAAQQANFTVCTHVLADHAAAIRASLDGRESADKTQKFIIPSPLKRDFLSRLRMMNVTATSLFPGLDGLGRDARDLAVLRAWRSGSAR